MSIDTIYIYIDFYIIYIELGIIYIEILVFSDGGLSTVPQNNTTEKSAIDNIISEKKAKVILNSMISLKIEKSGDPLQQRKSTTNAIPNKDLHNNSKDDNVILISCSETVNCEGSTGLTNYKNPKVTDDKYTILSTHKNKGDIKLESES